jgi:hypothetical protein
MGYGGIAGKGEVTQLSNDGVGQRDVSATIDNIDLNGCALK